MASWWRDWLELLAPPTCAGCRRATDPGAVLCPRCDTGLTRAGPVTPLPDRLDACVAAVTFSGATESWIHRFKYPRQGLAGLDPAARAVANGLAREAAARAPGVPQLVVPVPLHALRLRARSFNPACELAREIARHAGAPLAATALERLRDTPSQTGLGRSARVRNVRGAFAARQPMPPLVWLVDDVVTTGATLSEAARALRRAGARKVVGVCAAATPAPP